MNQSLDSIRGTGIEHAIANLSTQASIASKGTYGGLLGAFFGWFSSSDAAILIGIFFTIAGFILNYVFQKRRQRLEVKYLEERNQREIELHLAQLQALKGKCDV